MRLIISGSRSFTSLPLLQEAVARSGFVPTHIVCGEARGADTLGREYAIAHNLPVVSYPALWDNLTAPGAVVKKRIDGKLYNQRAGFDRNAVMVAEADATLALWDGLSAGTANTIALTALAQKPVFVWVPTFPKKLQRTNHLIKAKGNPQLGKELRGLVEAAALAVQRDVNAVISFYLPDQALWNLSQRGGEWLLALLLATKAKESPSLLPNFGRAS